MLPLELGPIYRLGRVVLTPHARAALSDQEVALALRRHLLRACGELAPNRRRKRPRPLLGACRLLSTFRADTGVPFWIITEANRSLTRVLLPTDSPSVFRVAILPPSPSGFSPLASPAFPGCLALPNMVSGNRRFRGSEPDLVRIGGSMEYAHALPPPDDPMKNKTKPIHEVRLDSIKAAVWRNATEAGVRYNATFTRLYKDGDQWNSTDSFGRDDLLLLAKVADQTHSWICTQNQEDHNATKASTSKQDDER